MNYELINANLDHSETLSNLMQFYIYDFSEFMEVKVEPNGKFSDYPLHTYWTEDHHYPYLIKYKGSYAGFVLVKWMETETKSYFSIAEFFIMKSYRRTGLGKSVATDIFRLHQGNWEVFQTKNNVPAHSFWTNVIHAYTKGEFTERIDEGKRFTQVFVS